MSETGKRVEELGIKLPVRNRKGSGAVDAVLHEDMLYLSAHLPVNEEGVPVFQGKVGDTVDIDSAYQAARLCGLNMLATIKEYIGELDRVDYFVKALGLVNSAGDFSSQPAVMNGFSDLMVEVFGKRGQHARSAMGAYALPEQVPIVVEAIVKIRK
ncbi:RidA family protein [Novisyntrophococcus fermenticellae]|uniref:RidA family protein n=1 Tax=Novisyntrophococcus fermenticellae TaxID=2068655 RepID=UPI001E2E25B4|nr:RidA family protein [Novisyntrophococcus fermenticellae]